VDRPLRADRLTVISPHFDDAVLSCGSLIDGSARIITVCAGVPGPEVKAKAWDRICGFSSAEAAALARREEDAAACAAACSERVWLPVLDRPYAVCEATEDQLRAALGRLAGHRVYVPAAIGSHPDHRTARDLALRACSDAGADLYLYADVPYACEPSWGASDAERPRRLQWGPALDEVRAQGYEPAGAVRRRLGPEAAERKLALAKHYRSQLDVFRHRFPTITEPDGELATEVSWRLTPAANEGAS
jgi:LmbE family N-acetylglucosaminyl deacetylase